MTETDQDVILESTPEPTPEPDTQQESGRGQTQESSAWKIIAVKPRIDSFHQNALMDEIRALLASGNKLIALNLRQNRFLSLPVIHFCNTCAKDLANNGGQLVLIGCPEKAKRHFEIYGSLDDIRLVRDLSELNSL